MTEKPNLVSKARDKYTERRELQEKKHTAQQANNRSTHVFYRKVIRKNKHKNVRDKNYCKFYWEGFRPGRN